MKLAGLRFLQVYKNLQAEERITFRIHLLYSIIDGISLGVLALNEFVFVKSLNGSSLQLGFLFQFSMLVFLFLVFLNEFIRRIARKRVLIRYTVLITRLPLLFLMMFPGSSAEIMNESGWHAVFLGLFLLYYMGSPIIFPSINLLLKHNYSGENFGKLYSYSTSVGKVVMLVITFLYGWLLDVNNFAFTYILPIIGLLGVVSGFILSRIPYTPILEVSVYKGFFNAIRMSVNNMTDILRHNIAYRHFEIGFMLYGFAFMSTVTVIVVFFNDGLHLSYSSIAFYRNAYNVGAILLLPLAGKLIGIIGPRRFAIISYGSVVLYLIALVFTERYPVFFNWGPVQIFWGLIAYIIFHSVFAATMSLLWNIGSSYFAEAKQAGLYQEIHLSLTGFRAVFAPLIGVLLYELLGFTATFLIGCALLLTAMVFMIWSYKKEDLPILGRQV